jgi:cysteinyl-tRNA synthetase
MTHYRKKIKFSFENLDSARNGYNNLKTRLAELKSLTLNTDTINILNTETYLNKFIDCINDDLNAGEGLALTWELLKDNELNPTEKLFLTNLFDKIFGLNLDKVEAAKKDVTIPADITELAEKRKEAKRNKDFKLADELRKEIKEKGYEVVDEKDGKFSIKIIRL